MAVSRVRMRAVTTTGSSRRTSAGIASYDLEVTDDGRNVARIGWEVVVARSAVAAHHRALKPATLDRLAATRAVQELARSAIDVGSVGAEDCIPDPGYMPVILDKLAWYRSVAKEQAHRRTSSRSASRGTGTGSRPS